jgi:hypothetical protein
MAAYALPPDLGTRVGQRFVLGLPVALIGAGSLWMSSGGSLTLDGIVPSLPCYSFDNRQGINYE